MAVGGKQRPDYVPSEKMVGVFEGEVICVNPTVEEYKEVLGIELQPDSKMAEYIGETKNNNNYLRVDVWLHEAKTEQNFKVSFFLEDKERSNKEGTKFQYINTSGICSWASSEASLPDWFKKREYRIAKAGEEELYGFLRNWLSKLDYKDDSTELELTWSKLMKGNIKEIREQINGEYCKKVTACATVSVDTSDPDKVKHYQGVYNRAFLPEGSLKYFRLNNYNDEQTLNSIRAKAPKDLKFHERFIASIADLEYGCKDIYSLSELEKFDEAVHITSSSDVISDENPDY